MLKITILLETIFTTRTERKRLSCSTELLRQTSAGGKMWNPYGQQPRARVVKSALSFGLGKSVYAVATLCFFFFFFFCYACFVFLKLNFCSPVEATFLFEAFYRIRPRVFSLPKVPLALVPIWIKRSK